VQLQYRLDEHSGQAGAIGAAIDLLAGDAAELGHRRVGAVARLLLGDGEHLAEVFAARLDLQRREAA
jgi:hypothetical protein